MSSASTRREAVQYDQFEAFADAYVAEHGREPSIRAAVAALGGSNTTISDHKRAWLTRRERLGAASTLDENLPKNAIAGVYDAILVGLQPLWDEKLAQLQARAEQDSHTLMAQHEGYLHDIEDAERAQHETAQQLALVHKDVTHLTLRLEDLKGEKYEATKALSDLQTQHASVCSQMTAAIEGLEEKLNNSEQEKSQLQRQLNEVAAQLQESKEIATLQKQSIASLEDDVQQNATTHRESIEQLRSQHEHELQQQATAAEEHRQASTQLQKTVATLSEQNKSQYGDIERLSSQLSMTEAQLLDARRTIEQQASDFEALKSEKGNEVNESIERLLKMEKRLAAKLSRGQS